MSVTFFIKLGFEIVLLTFIAVFTAILAVSTLQRLTRFARRKHAVHAAQSRRSLEHSRRR